MRIGIAVPAIAASGRLAAITPISRRTDSASQAGFRRQSMPCWSPIAPSRAKARARTVEPMNRIEAARASARNRPRYGSTMIPPRSAANASPGAPKASSRVSVRSASGSREWANPRSIASPARRPPGCAAIAGPMPADRLARAAPDASSPARPAPITRTKATAGQRRPRRGAATWAMDRADRDEHRQLGDPDLGLVERELLDEPADDGDPRRLGDADEDERHQLDDTGDGAAGGGRRRPAGGRRIRLGRRCRRLRRRRHGRRRPATSRS